MNQGRIWCVVNPTVGLPLLIGSAAVTSLLVHYCVLSNTTWFAAYWNGKAGAKAAAVKVEPNPVAIAIPDSATGMVVSVAPATKRSAGEASFVITVSSPTGAQAAQTGAAAAVNAPEKVALASPATQ
jgi:light-harvesting protein B-800-850 alpha chain